MGLCYATHRKSASDGELSDKSAHHGRSSSGVPVANGNGGRAKSSFAISSLPSASPLPTFYSPYPTSSSAVPSPSPSAQVGASPARSTPRRFFKRPFPPPSPAKHIQASLRKKKHSASKPKSEPGPIPEDIDSDKALDKDFGYSRDFINKYELGQEVGRGHFGHTCFARAKKGELKGQGVAVKVVPKAKMTTAIAIDDVNREVKILRALSGHENLVQFYDACEDDQNVYIVMELCEGGELLDRILSRGGRYTEEDAKTIVLQILNIVSFCHLQGVVHRDLKPENFLFTTKDEAAPMKAIDFGLSDFVRPDERLNDIVGSAYYVAPEVLHRSYGTEADVWSIGVITYILLCGSRPFWARTESGIFRAVIRADPSFDEMPWPMVSLEAKDFVKRLLCKDSRKRMTASQALTHPWLRGDHKIPLDIFMYNGCFMKLHSPRAYTNSALSRTLTEDELVYLRAQYILLEPSRDGRVTLENFQVALVKNMTEAMKDARVMDILNSMDSFAFKKLDFEEFCAAAISVHQLEALDNWEQYARSAYEYFERDGNRPVNVEELANEVGLSPTVPVHIVFHDWVRHIDGRLSFTGFVKLLHGFTPRTLTRPQ